MELKTSSLSDLSDNQIKFLHNKKLSEDQLKIALAVDAESRRQGVNPEFVWPMVYQESKFQQDATSPKGAIGVMQLVPDTAKGLKVDPSDVQQNITGGISLLKELIQNPKIGNDPYKVLAGYNASTETRNKFYESGDLADLPDETIKHMYQVGKHYGGELPTVTIEPKTQSEPDKVVGSAEPESENIYSGTPVTEFDQKSGYAPAEVGAIAGLTGAGLGTIYSAKAPAFRMAQRVGLLPGGKPITPTDAADLVEKTMTPNSSGGKWAAKTGYGMGEGTVQESSSRYQRSMPSGKIAARQAKQFGPAMPGESPDLVQRQIDRSSAQAQAQAQMQAEQNKAPNAVSRFTGKIAGSSPVVGGLAAYGTGYNLQDAYNKHMSQDNVGAAKSGLGALASAAALVPKAAPYAGSVAATIDAERRLQEKDYLGAGTSALGAIAPFAAPFVFGPQVGIPVGIATALGSPIVNEVKDYIQRQRNP